MLMGQDSSSSVLGMLASAVLVGAVSDSVEIEPVLAIFGRIGCLAMFLVSRLLIWPRLLWNLGFGFKLVRDRWASTPRTGVVGLGSRD